MVAWHGALARGMAGVWSRLGLLHVLASLRCRLITRAHVERLRQSGRTGSAAGLTSCATTQRWQWPAVSNPSAPSCRTGRSSRLQLCLQSPDSRLIESERQRIPNDLTTMISDQARGHGLPTAISPAQRDGRKPPSRHIAAAASPTDELHHDRYR